jgi:CelD/BcsL family acetyltransferase involved in cellulose biosynthesis
VPPRVTLEIRTHPTRDELAALAPDWDALVTSATRPSPYLLYAWAEEWLRGPGAAARVAVVAAYRGQALVGLLPTCIVRRHRLRTLAFIGDRESWLADLLLAPGEPSSTALALLTGLHGMPYDVAAFTGVPGGSLLDAATAGRLRLVERAEHPVLDMPEGWEAAYAAKASSQRRSRDRKRERQLAAAGAYEEVIADSPAAIDGVFDDVLTVHALRWGGRRDGSEFGTPAGAQAQHAALRRLAAARHAGIVLLRLDGRPIGFQIWMTVGDTMYLHRSGVDPAAMRFSPGLIAMRRAIAHGAAELGTRHVEMQGAGDRYKLDLASRIQPINDAYGLARTPVGALMGATLAHVVRTRRRLREVEVLRRVYLEGPRSLLRKRPL